MGDCFKFCGLLRISELNVVRSYSGSEDGATRLSGCTSRTLQTDIRTSHGKAAAAAAAAAAAWPTADIATGLDEGRTRWRRRGHDRRLLLQQP